MVINVNVTNIPLTRGEPFNFFVCYIYKYANYITIDRTCRKLGRFG